MLNKQHTASIYSSVDAIQRLERRLNNSLLPSVDAMQRLDRRLNASLPPSVDAIQRLERRLNNSLLPSVDAMQRLDRRLNASLLPSVDAIQRLERRLNNSLLPSVDAMQRLDRRLNASLLPSIDAIQRLERRLNNSLLPSVDAMQRLDRRLNASLLPSIDATQRLERKLNASLLPSVKTVDALHQNAPTVRVAPFTFPKPKNQYTVSLWLTDGSREVDATDLQWDGGSYLDLFDQLISNIGLRRVSRDLFADGHYTLAVEQAYKYLINKVKARTGLTSNGYPLMQQVFSGSRPILRFNGLGTQSEINEQRGYAEIYSGAIMGIRNPRAHEHIAMDDPQSALELLTLANHLIRKLMRAQIRQRRDMNQK